MGGRALAIRDDISAQALRVLARREAGRRASARMFAIANALEGMSRAEAARELCAKLGDGGLRKAAYRGGWKPA
jgi:hypothetical protein